MASRIFGSFSVCLRFYMYTVNSGVFFFFLNYTHQLDLYSTWLEYLILREEILIIIKCFSIETLIINIYNKDIAKHNCT